MQNSLLVQTETKNSEVMKGNWLRVRSYLTTVSSSSGTVPCSHESAYLKQWPDCLLVCWEGVWRGVRLTGEALHKRRQAFCTRYQQRPHCLKQWIYFQQIKWFWKRYNAEICTVLGFHAPQNSSWRTVSGQPIAPIFKGQAVQEVWFRLLDPYKWDR